VQTLRAIDPQQRKKEFRAFAAEQIASAAAEADRLERLPRKVIEAIAAARYFASQLPEEAGGLGLDAISYGLLHEEIGNACSSARSIITVHDMVAEAIFRWGSNEQRERYLPSLASGSTLAAFAITEPEAGSDLRHIATRAREAGAHYLLSGTKKWITGGQIADHFLVLALLEERPATFLVDRDAPGLSIRPITGLLGMRAAMCAELQFEDCEVDDDNMVGAPGFGLSTVVFEALGLGRYGVAWGSVGIAQASVDSALAYSMQRVQFGHPLCEHQLIQKLLADMIVETDAARLLCMRAGEYRAAADPDAMPYTLAAKYAAARAAMRAASSAVQIHGANGCGGDYPVQRYFRDARIMEIIEGSSQMQQIMISKWP
jgi:hypothetical protein